MCSRLRPPIHLCGAADDELALCGTDITGRPPRVRPFPAAVTPTQ